MAKHISNKRTPRAILRADSDGMTPRKLTARVMSQADNQSELPIFAQQQIEQLIADPSIWDTRYHVAAWITAARTLRDLGAHFPVRTGSNNSKTGCETQGFLPGCSCLDGIPCARGCYAMGELRLPAVAAAWAAAQARYEQDPLGYFWELGDYLARGSGDFRFLEGGDAPDPQFFRLAQNLAERIPWRRFLIYTKRWSWASAILDRAAMPSNMIVYFSRVPGCACYNPQGFPETDIFQADGSAPAGWYECPGQCGICRAAGRGCWSGDPRVAFRAHGSSARKLFDRKREEA